MAKKKQFDWRTHSKPVRLLTAPQEDAFGNGVLAPLLELALGDPSFRFEIRPRSASLYRFGIPLLRVNGDGPFTIETESDGGPPSRTQVSTAEQVEQLAEEAARTVGPEVGGETPLPRRGVLHSIASVNSGGDLFADELVVIDTEYNLGQRRLDLVALRRSEGVTGPGGFANPELTFIDVRCCDQTLTGGSGLAAVAADLADFAKALSGEHLQRAKAELTDLTAQKVRLGLLPADIELRGLTGDLPELLVIFSDYDITDPAHDRAIVELAEKVAARHYPAALLRFTHYPQTPPPGETEMALREGEIATYREFKTYRQAGR